GAVLLLSRVAKVTGLEEQSGAELMLNIEVVVIQISRALVEVLVAPDHSGCFLRTGEKFGNTKCRPRWIRVQGDEHKERRCTLHIVHRRAAARIGVENTEACPYGRVAAQTVGQSEARAVVVLISPDRRIGQQRRAGPGDDADARLEVVRPSC